MDSTDGARLRETLAAFAMRHEALSKAEMKIKEILVTARSRDGAVEATVGVNGEASDVRFPDNRFQAMSAHALAESVMEALAAARTEVARRRTALMRFPR